MQQPKPSIVFVADRIRLSVCAARSNPAPESLAITIERNQSGSDTGWYPTGTFCCDDVHAIGKALHELMFTLRTGTYGKAPESTYAKVQIDPLPHVSGESPIRGHRVDLRLDLIALLVEMKLPRDVQ